MGGGGGSKGMKGRMDDDTMWRCRADGFLIVMSVVRTLTSCYKNYLLLVKMDRAYRGVEAIAGGYRARVPHARITSDIKCVARPQPI